MPTVIKVENLSKYYRLGLIGGKTLHDDLNRWWARVRKQPDPLLKIGQEDRSNGNDEYLWALRDINFEVQQGEIVGIIGRNGAGKSTLLKILSRITAPTSGQVKVKGRIASLLEVGTGFHPELTGRENIYLNGAILGMKKAEIDRKFDEIVAFAEVKKFIDTPVKRYSSGMYVRLAFAVAAHLEPEILVVDEVLAVGDTAFQKKCLGKMGDVAKEGRTVLFVSHNLGSVSRLCMRSLYLSEGLLVYDGSVEHAISLYVKQLPNSEALLSHKNISLHISFLNENGTKINVWEFEANLVVRVEICSETLLHEPAIDLAFYSENGVKAFAIQSDKINNGNVTRKTHKLHLEFVIRNIGLAVGELSVDIGLRANRNPHYIAWWQRVEALPISVKDLPNYHVPDAIIAPYVTLRNQELL